MNKLDTNGKQLNMEDLEKVTGGLIDPDVSVLAPLGRLFSGETDDPETDPANTQQPTTPPVASRPPIIKA